MITQIKILPRRTALRWSNPKCAPENKWFTRKTEVATVQTFLRTITDGQWQPTAQDSNARMLLNIFKQKINIQIYLPLRQENADPSTENAHLTNRRLFGTQTTSSMTAPTNLWTLLDLNCLKRISYAHLPLNLWL